ncbi:MAG: DUF547 domain-containing protein [Planctomycetota bacterium]
MHSLPALVVALSTLCTGCSVFRTSISPSTEHTSPPDLESFDHSELDRVLRRFVDENGTVNYQELKKDPADLERYCRKLVAFSPDSHPDLFSSDDEKLAYWINAYNASAILVVLNYYPIESVRDVRPPWPLRWLPSLSGFFVFQGLTFGGRETSLYYLENRVLRERFRDSRIHFALNCASSSCPRLPRFAFRGEELDSQLDREARRFCGETRNVRIEDETRTIVLSSIFEWYEGDFVQDLGSRTEEKGKLLDAISEYLPERIATQIARVRGEYSLVYEPYDWSLNDSHSR